MFSHTVAQTGYAIQQNKPLLQLSPVTNLDVVAARAILELLTELTVAVIIIIGFCAMGIQALPKSVFAALSALIAIWLAAIGVGLTNAIINMFTTAWDRIVQIGLRLLYVASGIFYLPETIPEWARRMLWWNPVLHAVGWFRAGFFPGYQPDWLSRACLLCAGLAAILLGLVLERVLRRRISFAI
jgi:capsular polysaccharide transport system permease protein